MAISALTLYCSSNADGYVKDKNVDILTIQWFTANCFAIFLSICSETWLLTLFEKEDKARATTALVVGSKAGEIISYNIFILLSDPEWLNTFFFSKHPRKEGLLTHQKLLKFISLVSFGTVLYITFFVAEKQFIIDRKDSFKKVFKVVKKVLSSRTIIQMLILAIITKFCYYMVFDSIIYKLIGLGIKQTSIVDMQSMTIPLQILVAVFSFVFVNKKTLMRSYWALNLGMFLLAVHQYLIYRSFKEHKKVEWAERQLQINFFLQSFGMLEFVFCFGYLALIIDPKLGATSITLFGCIVSLILYFSEWIGMRLVDVVVSYENYVWYCFVLNSIGFVIGFFLANFLDQSDLNK